MAGGKAADPPSTSPMIGTPDSGFVRDRESPVRLVDVSKLYDGAIHPAIDQVNIAVQEGEFFSILGPSGSGKTTTLRVLAGFERPTTGTVHLGGADVTERPPNKRDVNTVFQNYALFPHMTVAENVAYPLKMARVDKEQISSRAGEMLEKVEMNGFEARKPHQLSGGQRQRVALARALVGRPRVLLLDEPLGALDLKLRETMRLVLRSLQRDIGITFIYVTHDQGEALGMSDRIAVMNHGLVEQVASPDDLYWRPSSDFVARFIGKTNLLNCTFEYQNGRSTVLAGSLPIVIADTHTGSGSLTLSLRPEEIVLDPPSGSLPNQFTAIVDEILFLGHEKELVTKVHDQTLLVRVAGRSEIRRGDTVEIGWSEAAAVVVRHSMDEDGIEAP